MPMVQVDLRKELFESKGREISQAIHQSLIDGLAMDPTDLFQVFRPHDPQELIFSTNYAGRNREDLLLIRVTMVRMFSLADKQLLKSLLTKNLCSIGIRCDDILLCILENGGEDWSIGEPEALI